MKPKKGKVQLYLTLDNAEKAKELLEKAGTSVSAYVDKVLIELVKAYESGETTIYEKKLSDLTLQEMMDLIKQFEGVDE